MIRSIVKDSSRLRNALVARWDELKLTQQDVADDAAKLGKPSITRQKINRYINKPYTAGAATEPEIIWLAWRWEIYVSLAVGKPSKQVEFQIPKTYNEARALKKLKDIFPETQIPE